METSLLGSALRPRQVKVEGGTAVFLLTTVCVPPEEGVRGRRESHCVFV